MFSDSLMRQNGTAANETASRRRVAGGRRRQKPDYFNLVSL
ncbi:hypothetical protein HMPREF9123_2815 [Neisseria bacilliformis ATCC BAA-1200]|uniref:Uncharacterized protein n=1 Tax=Neisseria bacilliformis ATCC BAA-1200 TaxID=888742 RepID=F2BGF8_9NEIS|nr:hypothetical protein HMPREF9123_2815 [Neisseria bacilliformis ATCC BAA-1200]